MVFLRLIVRWGLRSMLLVACAWLLACAWQPAHAQTLSSLFQVDMQAMVYKNGQAQAGLTATRIAASPPADFTAFNPNLTYTTSPGQSIWLKVRIRSTQAVPANVWLIEVSKPYVDTVIAYTAAPYGTWWQQVAGDWTAHSQWPNPSLAPQFNVPGLSSGQGDVYLEIQNSVPLNFKLSLVNENAAKRQTQNTFLIAGLFLGPMVFLAIACFFMAMVYRMAAYAWYAAYVTASVVFGAAYLGLGGYALWPQATVWSEASIAVTSMVQMMLQLLFARTMFVTSADKRWLRYGIRSLLLVDGLAILLYWMADHGTARLIIYTIFYMLAITAVLTLVLRAVRRGGIVAWLWVLANTPLIVASGLAAVEGFGYAAVPWLPYNAVLFALAFEMVILWVALHLSAREAHSQVVQKNTLAGTDPLTGFVTAQVFPATLEQLWDAARAQGHDITVAYILVTHHAPHTAAAVVVRGQAAQRSAARAVRLLRTVVREQDIVAHVDKDVFAVLMPNLSLGNDVTSRLARLIALAAMTDRDAAQHTPIRFHIAAASARSFEGSSRKLNAALRAKLNQTDWGLRAIRYVRKKTSTSRTRDNSKPNETLSQFWERAAADENYQGAAPAVDSPSHPA